MVFGVLGHRAVGKVQQSIQGILGIRLKALRHGGLPLGIDPAGIAQDPFGLPQIHPLLFVQAGLAVHRDHGAQQVLEHVPVVHPHVDENAPEPAHVPPQGDHHRVLTADRVHLQKPRDPNGTGIQQGARQPVDWVPTIVLGHADHDARVAASSLANLERRSHGQTHGLLGHHMDAHVRRFRDQVVMQRRRRGDVNGLDPVGGQGGQIGHGHRFGAQLGLGQTGQRLRVLRHRIAGRHQVQCQQALLLQFHQPHEVPVAHAAATDDGETQVGGHRTFSL